MVTGGAGVGPEILALFFKKKTLTTEAVWK